MEAPVGSPEHVRDLYLEPREGWGRDRIDRVLAALGPRPNDRVLDLGCANGTFAYHAAGAGAFAVGVDRDAGVLARGREAMRLVGGPPARLRLVAADARRLPFRERSFTKVVSADFLEHLDDATKRAAVGEAARVVLPGGPVVLYTPSRTRVEWEVRGERWKWRLGRRRSPPPASWREVVDPDHFGEASAAEVEALARAAGLEVDEATLFEVHVPLLSRLGVVGRLLEAVPAVRRTFGNRILVAARRPRPAEAARRRARTLRAALAAASLAAAAAAPHLDRHPVAGDEGVYVDLARSIAAGRGYVHEIGPSPRVEAHYPPLWPALLAGVAALRGDDPVAYRAVSLACGAGAAAAGAVYLRAALAPGAAFAAVALALHPELARYSTEAITEAPALALALLCLLALEAWRRTGRGRDLVAAALLAAAAFYVRSAAIALVATVPLYALLVRGVRPAAAAAAILAAAAAPWAVWTAAHGEGYVRGHVLQVDIYDPSKGAASLADLGRRLAYHAAVYPGRIAIDALFPPFWEDLAPRDPRKVAASVAVSAGLLLGAVRSARVRLGADHLFAAAHAGLCLVHPVYAPRYLFPLLPVLLRFFASLGRPAAAGAALLVAAGAAATLGRGRDPDPAWRGYMEAVGWIDRHAPAGAVVVGRRPETVRMHAGRPAVSYPASADPAALASFLDEAGARYVIVDDFRIGIRSADEYLRPAMEGLPGRFRLMYVAPSDPRVEVHEVVR